MKALTGDLAQTLVRIARTPDRLSHMLKLGPRRLFDLCRFLTLVIPAAGDELAEIRRTAERIPDIALRTEALASIRDKAYHVQGGCILATFLTPHAARRHIEIVTALETIYDYLDNLCDRLEGVPCAAYPTLHEALLDAVDLSRTPGAYYRNGPTRDDGGYLRMLVERVRRGMAALPNYARIAGHMIEATLRYAELQSFKHLPPGEREDRCRQWHTAQNIRYADFYWYEFAAACGSSLPVFAMAALGEHTDLDDAQIAATFAAYFPMVSGLHIMLDYFIDQAEDRDAHELNFVACYPTPGTAIARLSKIASETMLLLADIPEGANHQFVMRAMCGFYLTHPKVFAQDLQTDGARLLAALG